MQEFIIIGLSVAASMIPIMLIPRVLEMGRKAAEKRNDNNKKK
jgi:hypothetical protein